MSQNNAKGLFISTTTGGDISGNISSTTVNKIQNRSVLSGTPSNNQVLTWVNANNRWEAANPPSFLQSSGANTKSVGTFTSSTYNVTSTDVCLVYTGSTGTKTVNLPATAVTGRLLFICNITGGSTTLNITPSGGTTINGSGSTIGISSTIALLCYNGTNWVTVGAPL